jgi:hypothetical protein
MTVKNAVFWGVAPCRCSRLNRRFGGSYIAGSLRLVASSAATCSRWFFARGFFYPEDGGDTILQSTTSTRRHTPEDGILHSHRRENLKSYKL